MPTVLTKLRGYEGQVYYTLPGGTAKIFLNLSDWELDVSAAEIDFTDKSTSGWEDKGSGLKSFKGTMKAMAIDGGPSAQDDFFAALTGAQDVIADFRQKDVTASKSYTGTISITGFKASAPSSGAQTIDITFSGRGVLTEGTVTLGGS